MWTCEKQLLHMKYHALFYSEKYKREKMSYAAVVISTLRVNQDDT